MKKRVKRIVKGTVRKGAKALPRSVRSGIRDLFAELSGTREIRDSFRQYYGDFEIYNQLLKDKSDVTEYHVDKIIREVGEQLARLEQENQALKQRIAALEKHTSTSNKERNK